MRYQIQASRHTLALLLGLSLLASLHFSFVPAAHADGGELLGTTTLQSNGDTDLKLDLVFLGDGFTANEQDDFNKLVDQAVIAFLSAHPIHAMQNAFNVHRVNVASPESGTDIYAECDGVPVEGATDVRRRTAMDSGYCSGGTGRVNRCMFSSDLSLVDGFAANAPGDDITIVLVNDPGHGGCARFSRKLTFLTVETGFEDTVTHELGHAAFELGDEYNYGRGNTYTGSEPTGRANLTIASDRASLKWGDLVLPTTQIPTQNHPDCSVEELPDANVPADIVGTFEGANYRRCGIYRPQYKGRMRVSQKGEFHAVNRRKIIRTLRPHLDRQSVLYFHELLIKNDHDGWSRGAGDIYMNYVLSGNPSSQGRWPISGDVGIDTGDTKALDISAGIITQNTPTTLDLKIRDSDWPDGDDTIRNDVTMPLPPGGIFSINERDYQLRARVIGPVFKLLFDTLHIKNDHDGWLSGAGDIYMHYTISNGIETVSGRWPVLGDIDIDTGDTKHMNIAVAPFSRPGPNDQLRVQVRIMDNDFFTPDDELGNDTFVFTAADNFGADKVIHIQDRNNNYRLTLSIIGAPPQQPDPDPIIE